jgi:hypothetical protein
MTENESVESLQNSFGKKKSNERKGEFIQRILNEFTRDEIRKRILKDDKRNEEEVDKIVREEEEKDRRRRNR